MSDLDLKELKYGSPASRMELNEIYFWTDTILDWNPLLSNNWFKSIIIKSWQHLINQKKIIIYGFVIMPNHLHLLWKQTSLNGKEMPHASFNKFTSHTFLKYLKTNDPNLLEKFKANEKERKYQFWQLNPLAVKMDSLEKFEQKLNYIHLNPLQEKWSLVDLPEMYHWSSAKYYESGIDDFNLITHYEKVF